MIITYSSEACNLISESLRLDNGDLLGDTLVGVEIQSKAVIVFLDNDSRSLFNSLSADTTCGKLSLYDLR